jgi:hypothetical protein
MEVKVYYTNTDTFICPICGYVSEYIVRTEHDLCDHVAAVQSISDFYNKYIWYVMA